jgi:CBS domain-containing protein
MACQRWPTGLTQRNIAVSTSIGTTCVKEIMNSVAFKVGPKDKIASVAKLFEKHDVNAAPVVNDSGVCVGIITSHDVVEYESSRIEMENHLARGLDFEVAHYGDGRPPLLRVPIDEVGIQMTSQVKSVEPHAPLSVAARLMCQEHFHHVIILDPDNHPIGILSSLDILSHILGEPVARREKE